MVVQGFTLTFNFLQNTYSGTAVCWYNNKLELANTSKKWGWCLDNNRAYRGTSCGPDKSYGVNCKKWIWNDVQSCPKKCTQSIPSKVSKVSKVLPMCPKKKNLQKCPMKKEEQCICE